MPVQPANGMKKESAYFTGVGRHNLPQAQGEIIHFEGQFLWRRGGGQGSVSEEAVEFCRAKGIEVVPGQCPFMFLQPVRSFHWFHRFVFKITGQYPRATA